MVYIGVICSERMESEFKLRGSVELVVLYKPCICLKALTELCEEIAHSRPVDKKVVRYTASSLHIALQSHVRRRAHGIQYRSDLVMLTPYARLACPTIPAIGFVAGCMSVS